MSQQSLVSRGAPRGFRMLPAPRGFCVLCGDELLQWAKGTKGTCGECILSNRAAASIGGGRGASATTTTTSSSLTTATTSTSTSTSTTGTTAVSNSKSSKNSKKNPQRVLANSAKRKMRAIAIPGVHAIFRITRD